MREQEREREKGERVGRGEREKEKELIEKELIEREKERKRKVHFSSLCTKERKKFKYFAICRSSSPQSIQEKKNKKIKINNSDYH